MNIHNMHVARYVIAVSEELSFTAAAKRCGISQPSLSNAIQDLEEQLGGRLFLRTYRTRGVKITKLERDDFRSGHILHWRSSWHIPEG